MPIDVAKSVVSLKWFDIRKPDVLTKSTGFVINQCTEGFSVISSFHQIPELFDSKLSSIPKEYIGVDVLIFDNKTSFIGVVSNFDKEKNLVMVMVMCKVNGTSTPCDGVVALGFSSEEAYKSQQVYAYHCPGCRVGSEYTQGFVADDNFQSSGKICYHLPLMTSESAGAPVCDSESHRVVCMVHTSIKGTGWSPTHHVEFQLGIPVSTILEFFEDNGITPEMLA